MVCSTRVIVVREQRFCFAVSPQITRETLIYRIIKHAGFLPWNEAYANRIRATVVRTDDSRRREHVVYTSEPVWQD